MPVLHDLHALSFGPLFMGMLYSTKWHIINAYDSRFIVDTIRADYCLRALSNAWRRSDAKFAYTYDTSTIACSCKH